MEISAECSLSFCQEKEVKTGSWVFQRLSGKIVGVRDLKEFAEVMGLNFERVV